MACDDVGEALHKGGTHAGRRWLEQQACRLRPGSAGAAMYRLIRKIWQPVGAGSAGETASQARRGAVGRRDGGCTPQGRVGACSLGYRPTVLLHGVSMCLCRVLGVACWVMFELVIEGYRFSTVLAWSQV